MLEFALHLPLNNVSFGQTAVAILREIHVRGYSPCLFPIGPSIDLSTQRIDPEFGGWLNQCLNKTLSTHKRSTPVFKLWHINSSLESVSEKQVLLTFYELDSPTREEINTIRNNTRTIVTSKFTKNVFSMFGLNNVDYVPLGFDKYNFYVKPKQFFLDGRITFNLTSKLERRKHHAKVIQAWKKRFGGNVKYFLNCAIYNPFFKDEDNKKLFAQIIENKICPNIEFLGFMSTNEMYNDYLNSGDIIIGMSGAEGFGLPEFQSVALGKHAVLLNAHVYTDWANSESAVLVNPTGKVEAYDGAFFHKGQLFNQGNIFTWDDDEFIHACEVAIERVENNRVNEAGLKLQNEYTTSKTVDSILDVIKSIQN